ncbi:MAG: S8 family serine peptidase [Acidobacteriota bacterium]|nr:S8 family serine peptidase [Acidobacteriota bacterium]
MRRSLLIGLISVIGFWAAPMQASGRLIVRVVGGLPIIKADCLVAGCNVVENIDGSPGQLFLVTTPDSEDVNKVLATLLSLTGVVNAELDLIANVADSRTNIPPALLDNTPTTYYGSTVPDGYIHQPATELIRLANTQSSYPKISGDGIVAVIDTGVDPNHPALKSVLLPGYDFTRNQPGGNELLDVSLPGPPIINGAQPNWVSGSGTGDVSQSTVAVVDQSSAAAVDGKPQYKDFGHGTMVAGLIHLVAPTAKILPLKAFRADGTGYTSDILRAIYGAMASHANVLNMSFTLASYSTEVATALRAGTLTGIISVAAAGNSGERTLVYPAALSDVLGIASSTNNDQLSSFSNYGEQLVWIAAPGEGVVTTYPFSTYAAAWGTSFSTPLVSGVTALLFNVNNLCDQYCSANSTSHAQGMDPNAGHGRLDIYQAVQSWSQATGGGH